MMLLLLSLAAATMRPDGDRQGLAIATWNMVWLVSPAPPHAARLACRAGRRSSLPCDVARRLSRDSADISRLAWYARRLDADIIAFQEVEDAQTAARIFSGYRICIAGGHGLQHVGFAVRPGLAHRCGPSMEGVSLGGAQRPGMSMQLFPGSAQAIELLNVHLKSGCADDPLDSGSSACMLLARQARQLASWIDSRDGTRFVLLGDFNRGDADVAADEFWAILSGADRAAPPFLFAGAGVPFRNCHIGGGFTRAIDHILVSRALRHAVLPGGFRKPGYAETDVVRYRLADHCPVSFLLDPRQAGSSFPE
jgi:endonuclease/exonuclease/phosphatase family metal-dependent hydrolase